jgi:hypothetical protein
MLLDEDKVTEAAQFQRQRCAAFGARTAEKIRGAGNCQFSLLPHEELARITSGWYDASAQAMLNGNFSLIDSWTQGQAQLAAEENFELEDMLELLRICRGAAIEDEKWSEDIFSVVDDAINEALRFIGPEVSWNISGSLDYLHVAAGGLGAAEERAAPQRPVSQAKAPPQPQPKAAEAWSRNLSANRRDFGRNSLRLPIRVRAASGTFPEELTHSENVSRSGLYFVTHRSTYELQMALRVTYPYWTESNAINQEYTAKVVRLDRLRGGMVGVAVEFTDGLGPKVRD